MSATVSAIIEQVPAVAGKPSITYRQAGDRAVLVEYGEMEFDLRLNFFVIAVDAALRAGPPEGFVESAPGFRSILVAYEPDGLDVIGLVAHLGALHDGLPAQRELEIPSRLIRLPIAFDDSQSTQAVERYAHSIRKDAPNCEGGNNIDYVVSCNGLSGRDEVYESILATEQWTGFIGFFPGLPFMFPLDPRHVLVAPSTTRRERGQLKALSGWAARASRSIRSSRPAATSSSAGRSRSTTSRGATRSSARTRFCSARVIASVPPGRGGGAALALGGRAIRPVPLRDRGQPVRRRRLPRVDVRGRGGGGRAPPPPRARCRGDAGAVMAGGSMPRPLEMLEGGIQTTVQDYPGRRGMLAQGFFPAGPMDHFALRAANLLVGNPESAAGLEVTLGGAAFRLESPRPSPSAARR